MELAIELEDTGECTVVEVDDLATIGEIKAQACKALSVLPHRLYIALDNGDRTADEAARAADCAITSDSRLLLRRRVDEIKPSKRFYGTARLNSLTLTGSYLLIDTQKYALILTAASSETGKKEFSFGTSLHNAAVLSPCETFLYCAGSAGLVRIALDAPSAADPEVLHTQQTNALWISPCGDWLFCRSPQKVIRVYSVPTMEEVGVVPGKSMTISDCSRYAVAITEEQVLVWDIVTREVIQSVPAAGLKQARLSPCGTLLAGVAQDQLLVFSLSGGGSTERLRKDFGDVAQLCTVRFGADNKIFVGCALGVMVLTENGDKEHMFSEATYDFVISHCGKFIIYENRCVNTVVIDPVEQVEEEETGIWK